MVAAADAAMQYLSPKPKAEVRSGVRFSPPASDRLLSFNCRTPPTKRKRGPAFLPNPWLRAEFSKVAEDAAADANGIGLGARDAQGRGSRSIAGI